MSIVPGQIVGLAIEKPAAGGRMIARLNGQVVLVAGAIPGERVTARIERLGKGVVFAQTVAVEDASPDRREPFTDPQCGGCLYAHIAYPRQLDLKAQVIADAFGRIGRVTLPAPVDVARSPDRGYRMRARLHLRGGRAGFFREGTHEICDARATGQLLPATCDAVDRIAAAIGSLGLDAVRELDVSENVEASQRVFHLDAAEPLDATRLAPLAATEGLSGLTSSRQAPAGANDMGASLISGDPHVTDVLLIDGCRITLRRHVLAFFQGNRHLLRDLVGDVVGQIDEGSELVDLYAGTGLFAVSAAVARGARVTAVEGDRVAVLDLRANVEAAGADVTTVHRPVESFAAASARRPSALVVDPPRTGLSRAALDIAIGLRARTVLYVSCDVATLARDARRLIDAGYELRRVHALDMFPNTPHVETIVTFEI